MASYERQKQRFHVPQLAAFVFRIQINNLGPICLRLSSKPADAVRIGLAGSRHRQGQKHAQAGLKSHVVRLRHQDVFSQLFSNDDYVFPHSGICERIDHSRDRYAKTVVGLDGGRLHAGGSKQPVLQPPRKNPEEVKVG